MSATAARTLLVDEEREDVEEEVEAEAEVEAAAAAEERETVASYSSSSSDPAPRCGLRSSSEGSRRVRERERRFFAVFAFSVSLGDEGEAAAAPPPRRRCKDRDRCERSRVSRPLTLRSVKGAEAILVAFHRRERTESAEPGGRGDAPARGGARAQQQHCRGDDAIVFAICVAMAPVSRALSHAGRRETCLRKPLRATGGTGEPEKGREFAAGMERGFFLFVYYFPLSSASSWPLFCVCVSLALLCLFIIFFQSNNKKKKQKQKQGAPLFVSVSPFSFHVPSASKRL